LTRALNEQVRRFARALGQARRGGAIGVHRSRVASRRIREILPLLDQPRLAQQVRRVAAALGAVRELDVTRTLLVTVAARYRWDADVVADVRARLDDDRADRHRHVLDELDRARSRALLRALRRAGVGATPEGPALESAVRAGVQRRAANLAVRLRELGMLYVPDRLHEVRIAAKKLRYSLETWRDVHRAPVARDIRTLTNLQALLGDLHDLQVLQAHLGEAPRGARKAEVQRMLADLERECRTLHARVITRSPAWLRLAERVSRP